MSLDFKIFYGSLFDYVRSKQKEAFRAASKAEVEAALFQWFDLWLKASYVDSEVFEFAGAGMRDAEHDGLDVSIRIGLSPTRRQNNDGVKLRLGFSRIIGKKMRGRYIVH